jgi:hypothetical protein
MGRPKGPETTHVRIRRTTHDELLALKGNSEMTTDAVIRQLLANEQENA